MKAFARDYLPKFATVVGVFSLLALAPQFASADGTASDPGSFESNGFRLNAIEYWGKGGYDRNPEGDDPNDRVSFGFRSNTREWNQHCATLAYNELKAALDSVAPEMRDLMSVGGPTGIYIIVSDWTGKESQFGSSRVWHYNASETGQSGLIKFHAQAMKAADGSFKCNHPSAEDLKKFAVRTKMRIDSSLAEQSRGQPSIADRVTVPVSRSPAVLSSGAAGASSASVASSAASE